MFILPVKMSSGMSFLAAVIKNTNFVTLKVIAVELPKCASCYQTVRWRKPRWVAVSASKQFYVPKPKQFHPEDATELKKRLTHYNTSFKALRRFITETYRADMKRQFEDKTQQIEEQDEFDHMIAENDKWNAKVAEVRELRQAEEQVKLEERISRTAAWKQRWRDLDEKKAAQVLQTDLEASKHFITEDTLHTDVEKLMNQRKDYNFALNVDGQKVTDFPHEISTEEIKDESDTGVEDTQDKPV